MNRDILVTIFCAVALLVGGVLVGLGKADASSVVVPVVTGFLGYLVPRDGGGGKGAAASLVLGLVLASQVTACTPGARRNAADVTLSIAQMACVLYEANAGKPVPEVLTACHLLDDAAPLVRDLIEANHQAAQAARLHRDLLQDGGR